MQRADSSAFDWRRFGKEFCADTGCGGRLRGDRVTRNGSRHAGKGRRSCDSRMRKRVQRTTAVDAGVFAGIRPRQSVGRTRNKNVDLLEVWLKLPISFQ